MCIQRCLESNHGNAVHIDVMTVGWLRYMTTRQEQAAGWSTSSANIVIGKPTCTRI